MRRFVLGWKKRGLETRLGAKIVAYADDLVICCRGSADEAMTEMRWLMTQLKLTVNEAKTHIRRLPQERFEFLGYDFGRDFSPKTGRAYLCPQPSKASVKRVIGKIRDATERRVLWLSAEEMVTGLNRVLIGWANYYSLGPVYQAGTLSGNPVAVAAGRATLNLVQAPGFFERLAARTCLLYTSDAADE